MCKDPVLTSRFQTPSWSDKIVVGGIQSNPILFIVEVHLALKLVHRHSTLKQTSQVQNPNQQEANQLVIYKHSRGDEPRTTWNKSFWWSEWNLNSGSPDFNSSTLTTRPRCLPPCKKVNKRLLSHSFTHPFPLSFFFPTPMK